jgi:hypothetical protein
MVKLRLVVLAVLLAVPMLIVASAPASAAGEGCNPYGSGSLCVTVNTIGPDTVFGHLQLSSGTFTRVSIYVRQCHVDLTNCVTIAANSTPQYPDFIATSRKDAPFGHVFATFGTWQTTAGDYFVNVRSPWRSNP